MSWTDWVPPPAVSKTKAPPAAVAVSCGKPGMRYARGLRITIRPEMLEGAPAFLAPGKPVRVQVGGEGNAGMVRLVPGRHSDPLLRKSAGRSVSLQLVLPGWTPLPTTAQPRRAVEYDYGDGWLSITLPAWAAVKAAAPVAAAKPGAKPFIGAATVVPAATFNGMRGGR